MLPGLCVWLDDTVGVKLNGMGNMQKWLDQSGNGTDMIAAGAGAPVMTAAINGHDAISLNQGTTTINDATCLQFGTSPFALVTVAYTNPGSSYVNIWSKNASTTGLTWVQQLDSKMPSQQDLVASSHTATVTFANVSGGGYQLLELKGPSLVESVSGVAVDGGVATDDLGPPGVPVTLGGGPGFVYFAEIMVVSKALSAADEASIQAYVHKKFGL